MIKKVEESYFAMGFKLMSGIVVDEELAKKLQEVFDEAKAKIKKLVEENPDRCRDTESDYAWPRGKQTDFNYIAPKGMFDRTRKQRLYLLDQALSMNKVDYLFESDQSDKDAIKAFAQRAIEDEQDRKGGSNE